MINVAHGVVRAPNEDRPGDRRANGFLPLAGTLGVLQSVAYPVSSNCEIGTSSLVLEPSPVCIPDHRFHVGSASKPAERYVLEPGHGAIPVEPIRPTSDVMSDTPFIKTC